MKPILSKLGAKSAVSSETVSWYRRWVTFTLASSIFITIVDAALIQKKSGLLAGGFLSDFSLDSSMAVLGFVLSSLICDSGIMGFFILFTFFLLRRWKARARLWEFSAFVIAISPLLAMDFIRYKLEIYIGDIFKLLFLFDLTGKSLLEFLAVSDSQILILLLFFAISALFLILFFILREKKMVARIHPLTISWSRLLAPLALLLVSILYSTVVRLNSERLDFILRKKPAVMLMGFLVNRLSDFDGDGFGLLAKPADPAPFDPAIFPYAVDIPGNGVDENGVGGDLPLEVSANFATPFTSEKWVFKPDLIFVMLESFRPDLLGSRFAGKYVTPVMNSLAKSGVSSESAYSHNGYTTQSRYHSLTGEFPGNRRSLLHDFKINNYFVAYFSAQDVSFGGSSLSVGFDEADISYDARVEPQLRFNTFSTPGSSSLSNQVIKKKIINFLRSYDKSKPLFLYINFQDTHFPYWNSDLLPLLNDVRLGRGEMLPEKRDELQKMYKNTAANVDLAIGDILTEAKKKLGGDVAVVILSDHGESLFDDGFLGHGHMLNDHQTRIPLIVSGLPVVLEEPFGQVDLRSMLNRALGRKKGAGVKPVVIKNPRKRVFQYIGMLEKPEQIGFLKQGARFIYDFRRGKVKDWGGKWEAPSELSISSGDDLDELVHFWESVVFANRGNR